MAIRYQPLWSKLFTNLYPFNKCLFREQYLCIVLNDIQLFGGKHMNCLCWLAKHLLTKLWSKVRIHCCMYTHNHNDINNNSTYTNAKHICKNRRTQIHKRLRCSGTNCLLIFDFSSSTREVRQFLKVFRNYTMLTIPPMFGTSRGVLDLNSSSRVGTRKT